MTRNRLISRMVVALAVCTATVYAMRMAPEKPAPVTKDGVRYEAPVPVDLRAGAKVVVEAWDEKTNRKLWTQVVYVMKPENPGLEFDGDIIEKLSLDGDALLITSSGQIKKKFYRLDLKTRKVEALRNLPAPGADAEAAGAPDEAAARRLMLKWIKDNNRDAMWKDINDGAPVTAEQILVKAEATAPHLWQVTVRFKKGGSFGLHIEKTTGRILLPVD